MKRKCIAPILLSTVLAATSMVSPVYAAGPGAQTTQDVTDHEKQSATNSLKLAEEGLVLLQNNQNVLPLVKKSNVAVYGLGAVNTIKGGTGSGAVNNRVVYPDGTKKDGESISVSILDGLKYQGFKVTNESYINQAVKDNPDGSAGGMAGMGGSALHADPEVSQSQMTLDAAQADTGIYVIRRNAGEGADRTKTKGDWYLTDAELNNIKQMSKTFKNSIVLLNVVSVDSSWIKDVKDLDSVMLIGNPGELGGIAVAENLDGTVSPSGKLVDTWAKIEDYPSTRYFGKLDADDPYGSKVEYYGEGIYTGYRYFDTFAADKIIYDFGYGLSYTNFDITTKSVEVKNGMVNVKVNVTNTGDKYSGKEVVQVYFSAPKTGLDKPYQELAAFGKTDNLAPGQSQELTLSFKASEMSSYDESQAAYVMDAGDYIIRVGNSSRNTKPAATINLAKKVVTEQLTNQLTMDNEGNAVGGVKQGNQRQSSEPAYDISVTQGKRNYQSSVERFKAFAGKDGKSLDGDTKTATTVSLDASAVENTKDTAYANGDNENVTTYVSDTTPTEGRNVKGYNYQTKTQYSTDSQTFKGDYSKNKLEDVYNGKITLEQFVSGLTLGQLTDMVEGGNKSSSPAGQSGGGTSPNTANLSAADDKKILDAYVPGEAGETAGLYITSKGIPNTTNADGPAGLRVSQSFEENGKTYYQFETAYPAGQNNAQTWNVNAVYDEGVSVGQDMENAGVDVWLAPGMNIHRNPLCGRNFEYYSEDPLLAGKMGASIAKGVQSIPGRGVTIKHFALNNQETDRSSSNSVLSERALREIYLKQFEIAVREAQPMCVMSSYNAINNVPASDNYDLLENILRKEWGFQGMVMTDWGGSGGSQDARSMHAGNDIIMAGHEVSQNITSYITDVAPTWNGQTGYPVTKASTMAFGTFAWVTASESWGDYTPAADGKFTLTQTVPKTEFEKEGTVETATGARGEQKIIHRSAEEQVKSMADRGASYVENADGTVTITYKVNRTSDVDNTSIQTAKTASSYAAGKQDPEMSSVTGKADDYNTLTLADLQKSNMRILNMVLHTGNFYKLIGVKGSSYESDMQKAGKTTTITSESKGAVTGNNKFKDVSSKAFYYEPVYWALNKGITAGKTDTTFAPNDACTRGQMVQFLYKLAGEPEVKGTMKFTDVKSDAFYYKAVIWATEKGITTGKTDTTFAPNDPCTRGQMVQFLYQMAGKPAVTGNVKFTDVKSDAFYRNAVIWATEKGITAGKTNTTFAPNDDCTRGQMVTFLYKYDNSVKA